MTMYGPCYRCRACNQIFIQDDYRYTEEEVQNYENFINGKDFDSAKLENMHLEADGMHDCTPDGSHKGYMEFIGFERIEEDGNEE